MNYWDNCLLKTAEVVNDSRQISDSLAELSLLYSSKLIRTLDILLGKLSNYQKPIVEYINVLYLSISLSLNIYLSLYLHLCISISVSLSIYIYKLYLY